VIANRSKLLSLVSVLFSEDDPELMKKVAKGDHQAFEVIFNKYKGPIMNYVYQMVKNRDIAEDITHDVFLKIFAKADSYDPGKKFTTWLWSIAKNTTIDHIRKKKELLVEDITPGDENATPAIDRYADKAASEDAKLIQKAEREIVQGCMGKLPEMQREVIAMRMFSELPYQEIAKALNKSEGAIKSLIVRAKESLKKCVKQHME
jgi:RNA polymerase sigma-70 factor, ECF subfamily